MRLVFLMLMLLMWAMKAEQQFLSNGVGSNINELLDQTGKCEPLNTDVLQLCKDIAYNETRFPNFMKHKSQQEAAVETTLYLPLIKINCSPVLKLFLCSLYAPPCIRNYSQSILKPCREMCEKAKMGCEDFMKRFSFSWPDYIDCWRFPSFSSAEACVTDENYASSSFNQQQTPANSFVAPQQQQIGFNNNQMMFNGRTETSSNDFLSNLTPQQQQILFNSLTGVVNPSNAAINSQQYPLQNKNYYQLYAAAIAAAAAAAAAAQSGVNQMHPMIGQGQGQGLSSNVNQSLLMANIRVKFVCPPPLQLLTDTKNTYYLIVNDELVNQCGMPCDNNLFDAGEIQFSRSWILIWSALCFGSTLFTLMTFTIDQSRFRYPERPIIFISGCYMIVGLAYLIGSSSLESNSVVCKPHKNGLVQTREYLVQGVEHLPCTLLFMMIYFFSMASSTWWVILTLTWFLAAGLKWGHEAIEDISSYFHLAAWAIPGFKLIIILWLQKIDADILSGVCFTGVRNMYFMKAFVLAPLLLYLILGTCFLLTGFISLFRIRIIMKHRNNNTEKLEKFMLRIGVFSILYIIPAIIVICCYFYEQSSFGKWTDYWLRKNLIEFNLPPDYVNTSLFENDRSSLIFWVFMLKYAMFLIVGITSGFWIWSHKTISSWQRFFDKIGACFSSFRPKYKNEAAV